MRVFNLTDQRVDYRGKVIPPYGSEEYDLGFIPDRDKTLEKKGMLAFGALPKWWRKPEPKPSLPPAVVKAAKEVGKEIIKALKEPGLTRQVLAVEEVKETKLEVVDEVKTEDKSSNEDKSVYRKKRF